MILDGGVGTELAHSAGAKGALDEPLWGTRALIENPDAVLRVHREYVQAGCDVISTNTWGLASALAADGPRPGPVDGRRGGTGAPGSRAGAYLLNPDRFAAEGREHGGRRRLTGAYGRL